MNRDQKVTRWALIIVGLLGLLLVAGLSCWRLAGKAHYARVKAELIAAGEKLSIEEQLPVVKPGESNGGDVFAAHLGGFPNVPILLRLNSMEPIAPGRALVASAIDVLPFEVESGRWTNNLWDVLPAYVEPGRGAWVLLKAAVTNDVIALDLPYVKEPVGMRLPHLSSMRTLSAWLEGAIVFDLRTGNYLDAIDAVITGTELIAKYREPLVLSQFIRESMFAVQTQAIWETLQRRVMTEADLVRLQRALIHFDFALSWYRAWLMGRALDLTYLEKTLAAARGDILGGPVGGMTAAEKLFVSIRDGALSGEWDKIGNAGFELGWWFAPAYFDGAHYLRVSTRHIAELRKPVQARSFAAVSYVPSPGSDWYAFSRDCIFINSIVDRKLFQGETLRSIVLAAVGLERYRLAQGSYPAALDRLVPQILTEVPVDWFDGKPLRYERVGPDAFRLWSIGSNGIDGGGVPSSAGEDWLRGDDWVWPQPASEAEVAVYLARQRAKLMPPFAP